jgi:AcrR family transcriptional regulator
VSQDSSRAVILAAGRRLFAERGYKAVTIREVATEAGLSPAMVMKVVGSKAELFAAATPLEPERLSVDTPREQLGRELVRRVFARRDVGAAEPWSQALHLIQDAPDPQAARAEFRRRYLGRVKELLGDVTDDRRASLVICLLLGLAGGLRTLGLLDRSDADSQSVIEEYGALLQAVIDASGPTD